MLGEHRQSRPLRLLRGRGVNLEPGDGGGDVGAHADRAGVETGAVDDDLPTAGEAATVLDEGDGNPVVAAVIAGGRVLGVGCVRVSVGRLVCVCCRPGRPSARGVSREGERTGGAWGTDFDAA